MQNSLQFNSYSKLMILIFLFIIPWIGIPLYPYILIALISSFLMFITLDLKFPKIILLYGTFLFLYSCIIFLLSKEYSVFLYTLTIIFSYILISKKEQISFYISINKKNVFYIVMIISFILINFTWQLQREGRYTIFVGDSNFSAFWLLLLIFSFILISKKKTVLIKLLILLSIIWILFMTQSRMGLLAVLLFFSMMYFRKYKKLSILIGLCLLFFSMYGQLIVYYLFENFITIHNLSTQNVFDRLMNLNDTSNLMRVQAYYYALTQLQLNELNFLFGVKDYIKNLPTNLVVPHNWYITMSVLYGFVYSTLFTIFIIYLIIKMQNEFTPLLYIIILMSGILNINGVLIPIILMSLLYLINNQLSLRRAIK